MQKSAEELLASFDAPQSSEEERNAGFKMRLAERFREHAYLTGEPFWLAQADYLDNRALEILESL